MHEKAFRALGSFLAAGALVFGCAEKRREPPPPAPTVAVAPPAEAAPAAAAPAARPLFGASRTGSTLQLASFEGRPVALVLDEDARALRVVDADTLAELSHLALEGHPAQLVVAGDGRAYVALRDVSRVVAIEAGDALALTKTAAFDVATEPVSLATNPKGDLLVVTSAWGRRLAGYDVASHARRFETALGREPRGVTVSSDGATAHVAHAVGSRITRVSLPEAEASEISLAGSDFTPIRIRRMCHFPMRIHEPPPILMERNGMGSHDIHERDAVQGFAIASLDDRVFVPQVLVHRGEVTVGGYGTSEKYPAHQPTLAVVDGEHTFLRVPNQAIRADKSRYDFAGGARRDGCLLPRSIAADAGSKSVLVGCYGTNEVRVIDTKTTASLTEGTRRRYRVAGGPSGIAVDSKRRRALVWSQYARTLSVLPLPGEDETKPTARGIFHLPKADPPTATAKLGPLKAERPALSIAALRGRELFHGASDRRISADGRACASCHPDGREDGLTWPTPAGARQTPMLAGRLLSDTEPFGWHGDTETVHAHLKQTFTRLGGTGLAGEDLDALIAYCHEMATPPAAAEPEPTLVAHGKKLFFADTVGCATCHKNGGGSDGNRHAVGSGPELDTPSLRFVAGTAPYFHDGRYETLAELLTHSQGTMGWATGMTEHELDALEAYLLTL